MAPSGIAFVDETLDALRARLRKMTEALRIYSEGGNTDMKIANLVISATALVGCLFVIHHWGSYYAPSLDRVLVWLVVAAIAVLFLTYLFRDFAPKPKSPPDEKSRLRIAR